VRLLHHLQELPGVGGERLHVAALALGIDGVEGERRLARAGQPGEHHELVARDLDVDALEVVLARAADGDHAAVVRVLGGGAGFGNAAAGAPALLEKVVHGCRAASIPPPATDFRCTQKRYMFKNKSGFSCSKTSQLFKSVMFASSGNRARYFSRAA